MTLSPLYYGHGGVPDLTERQKKRLQEWREEMGERGLCTDAHLLFWQVQDEVRPGRGQDMQVLCLDDGQFAWLTFDVYGNGSNGYGDAEVVHNGGDDDCSCDDCKKMYAEEG